MSDVQPLRFGKGRKRRFSFLVGVAILPMEWPTVANVDALLSALAAAAPCGRSRPRRASDCLPEIPSALIPVACQLFSLRYVGNTVRSRWCAAADESRQHDQHEQVWRHLEE